VVIFCDVLFTERPHNWSNPHRKNPTESLGD